MSDMCLVEGTSLGKFASRHGWGGPQPLYKTAAMVAAARPNWVSNTIHTWVNWDTVTAPGGGGNDSL